MWARGTRVLAQRLTRAVKMANSAMDRPGPRPHRRRVSAKALEACKDEVRQVTSLTRGVALGRGVGERRQYLDGWYAYFGVAEAPSRFKALDAWIRRRRRCDLGKPWGRRRYRARRRRGVSRDLAWHTVKSAHGPWRLSRSPALAIALPSRDCERLGLPRLHRPSRH